MGERRSSGRRAQLAIGVCDTLGVKEPRQVRKETRRIPSVGHEPFADEAGPKPPIRETYDMLDLLQWYWRKRES
jgi:hypothetical protein